MFNNYVVLIATLVLGLVRVGVAQQKVIQHVPIHPTSAASGQQMFNQYCAVCHGKDGRGNGPAAEALKSQPTDLTQLAKTNGGKYPYAHVQSVIRLGPAIAAHGSAEMPVWGRAFQSLSKFDSAQVQQRLVNLSEYIRTLGESETANPDTESKSETAAPTKR